MTKFNKAIAFKLLIVYILLIVIAFSCFNIQNLYGPARKRRFKCNDESLKQPLMPDTVTRGQLYILAICFPLILLLVFEFISSRSKAYKSLRHLSWVLVFLWKSFIILTLFLIGLAAERLIKNIAKIKMGRLRPYFLTVCNPRDSLGFSCLNEDDIINDYECESDYEPWIVEAAFASFPSGHTSLITYSMMFLIFYLYLLPLKFKTFKTSCCNLVILLLQTLCFFIILFVGISRVLDFKHHWSDVLAGFVWGFCVALAVNYYLKNHMDDMENWLIAEPTLEQTGISVISEATYTNRSKRKQVETCTIEIVDE